MKWPVTDHCDGTRFFNPSSRQGRPATAVPRMLAEPRAPWPSSVHVAPRRVDPRPGSAWASITFVGHSTFVVQTPRATILTDPVFSQRASPLSVVGPKRVRQPGVRLDDLPPIDLVLLSHNHYDHCDLGSLQTLARRFDPVVVTPLGNTALLRSAGLRRIIERDWWQDDGGAAPVPVLLTPARHFSARTPFDRNAALWAGFVVTDGGRRLYFAGDSGYDTHFAEVGARLGGVDCALLPVGAYEPRWFMADIHMNPDEAVRAHHDVRAAQSIGMHYGTFRLTTEAIDEPLHALGRARAAHGIDASRFTTLDFGGTVHLHATGAHEGGDRR